MQLRHDVDSILKDPALGRGTWGVHVMSLATGEVVYALNDQKLLMPASNMKIVTLAAAAERLGWDFTFETRLAAAGRIVAGTLDGDLIAIGSGDPSIGSADGSAERLFVEWANRLKARGIHTVAGRIIGDDNAFDDDELGFGWSWDDLADDYAAGVSGLQYNENAVHVTVAPGPFPGDYAPVSAEPPASGLTLTNLVRTGPPAAATSLRARRLPGNQRLELSGTIAAGAAASTLIVSVDNPTQFFVDALKRALVSQGIDVRGPAVDVDAIGDPPTDSIPIASYRSPPLSTLAVRLMKVSQNQYAETFLKTLGRSAGSPGAAAAGRAAAQDVFAAWGVPPGSLILRDGSGLSRYDYVTASALATILAHVYRDATLRGPFEASLPIAGRDGTISNRMKGTAADGNARAKSGSMSNVRALSGYVTSAGGEPLAFAIIANNFETAADVVNRATDAIVVKLAEFTR